MFPEGLTLGKRCRILLHLLNACCAACPIPRCPTLLELRQRPTLPPELELLASARKRVEDVASDPGLLERLADEMIIWVALQLAKPQPS